MKFQPFVPALILGISSVVGVKVEPDKLKILVHSSVGGISHIKPLFEVCKLLQARGHEIKYAADDINSKYVKKYGYDFVSLGDSNGFEEKYRLKLSPYLSKKEKFDSLLIMGNLFTDYMTTSYKCTYLPLYKVVEKYQPDLMICDFFAPACRDVAEKLGTPLVIGFQTIDAFNIVPSQTNTGSMDYQPITTNELTFWQRINDKFLQPMRRIYYTSPLIRKLNSLRKQYGIPPSQMPFGRFDNVYGIANTFIGFEPATGIPSNINLVGPILSSEHDMIDTNLKAFINNNQRILYIAFGSNVKLEKFDIDYLLNSAILALENNLIDGVVWGLGKTLISKFPKTISLFNETIEVINLIEGQHDKIRILKWAPQAEILKHNNTKVFISHGGLESTFEAIASGTPIVSVPVMSDQPRNARKLEDMGIGKYVDRATTTPRETYKVIKYVMEDPNNVIKPNVEKYRLISLQNSKRKYKAAQDLEDLVALAKLCRQTEPFQVGKVPCEVQHLIPVSAEMSFIKANNLDLYLFALTSITALVIVSIYIAYLIVRFGMKLTFISNSNTKPKKD